MSRAGQQPHGSCACSAPGSDTQGHIDFFLRSLALDRQDHSIGVMRVQGGKHLGLIDMRERAEMLGGTCTVESTPGKGTTLRAQIPLHQRQRP